MTAGQPALRVADRWRSTPRMSVSMRRSLILLALVGLIVTACGARGEATADPVIDTWPVGVALGCNGPVADGSFVPATPPDVREEDADVRVMAACAELVLTALRGLDARDQGHAAVTSVAIHREGTKTDPATGDHIIFTRSGNCCYVLVADLEDGSRHAIGVGYPGISTEPIAAEWEVAGGRSAP